MDNLKNKVKFSFELCLWGHWILKGTELKQKIIQKKIKQ